MRVICITNHDLLPDQKMAEMSYKAWRDTYVDAIDGIAACHPQAIVLREKLLSGIDYTNLYEAVLRKTAAEDTFIIWHDHFEALRLYMRFHKKTQWPRAVFFSGREAGGLSSSEMKELKQAGISYGLTCHSLVDLEDVKRADADYMMASHIYQTNCKRDLKPKGIDFLSEVCHDSEIPVIALGGIAPDNAMACIDAGAYGVAVMSLAMKEDKEDLKQLISM